MAIVKSYPFFEQKDELDCGAACLRMVARHYKRFFSQVYLRELTHISQEGVSLLEISEAAEQIGFKTLAAKITFEQLQEQVPLPCIIHWKGYHFVVVYEADDQKIIVADPATSIVEFEKGEFLENWTGTSDESVAQGIVLLMEPTPELFQNEDEPIDRKKPSFLLKILNKYRNLKWQLITGAVFTGIIQLVMPFFIMAMVDVGITNENYGFIWLIMLSMLMLFISQTLIEYVRGLIINHVGSQLNLNLLTDFLMKMMKLPIRFFEGHTTGDLLQRISENERLERFLSSSALFSVFSFINLLLLSFVLLSFDWKIFLVFFFGTVAYLSWVRLFWKKRREIDFKRFEQSAINNSYLLEMIRGVQDIKLNNAERQRRWPWEKIQAKLYRLTMKARAVELWQTRGAAFFNELKNIVIISLAAQQVLLNNMTLGMMLATVYILGQLNVPINQLVELIQGWQEASNSVERMGEVHEMEEEEKSENRINSLPEKADLKLENVSFRYKGTNSPEVLHDLSVTIPRGKITAIVGSSGSGKTTLVKLLLGIYRPTEGAVRVGDMNLETLNLQLWRNKTAAVLQDGYIFSDTVAKNIALSEEAIVPEKIAEAIKLANLQKWVDALPYNYNTPIGETGIRLSEGIRQRLLLARAIYKEPDYLFLDEATSSLDIYNELAVLDNIKSHFKSRTVVVVAHRLSTIKFADQIILLENGEVLEAGTHATLYENRGVYFNLVKRQIELGG